MEKDIKILNNKIKIVINKNFKVTRINFILSKLILFNKKIFLKKRRIDKKIKNYILNIISKIIIYLFIEKNNNLRKERNYRKKRFVKLQL